jgi:hypothetical protein
LNGDLLSGRPSQEALHDWPIGFALGQGRGIAVLVHCGWNVRVSHEFLLYAHGCSGLVQPRTYISMRLMEGANIYQIAKNCRTSVGMIEKYYGVHIKNSLNAAAINVVRSDKDVMAEEEVWAQRHIAQFFIQFFPSKTMLMKCPELFGKA